ncbi:hypothetical protein [Arcobacter peruensis]|uniref:hypothetical protein n=1 Tax=Arcobacter peruensis TaxID=2320140 RepID=UPI000F074523|nr:hypothetical protein [Arcobacter peruensis]
MRILIFDTNSYEDDIYDIVLTHLEISFKKIVLEDEFYEEYKNLEENNLLIIDVTNKIGEKIFNHITNTTPKQKVLVLSKTLLYNLTFTCTQCAELFNRKLLLKPLNADQLIDYIQNFDDLLCKYSSDSSEITEIMNDILKHYIYYSYDKEKKMIMLEKTLSSNTKELLNITELLNTHKIRYEMEEDNIRLFF